MSSNPVNPTPSSLKFRTFALTLLLATPSNLAELQGGDPEEIRKFLIRSGVSDKPTQDNFIQFVNNMDDPTQNAMHVLRSLLVTGANTSTIYGEPPCPRADDAALLLKTLGTLDRP